MKEEDNWIYSEFNELANEANIWLISTQAQAALDQVNQLKNRNLNLA